VQRASLKPYTSSLLASHEAIEIDTKHVFAYANRGSVCQGKKNYERAIADYDKAIQLPQFALCP
jgi:tetratricopeptide (TPR) repeat protein